MTHFFLIFLTSNLSFIASCDASESWQLGLQDPATPIMESMLFFHNYLMMFLLAIGVFVSWMLISVFYLFNAKVNFEAQKFSHDSLLETFWTIVPAIILLFISIPSFALLYSLDELINPLITLKVVGHQWYWSYEYSDYFLGDIGKARVPEGRLNFDSYMISTSDLTKGALRLLEVDNRSVLPVCTHIRLIVTAADVLHSWSVPSFGIKIDACPGRLSQGSLFIKREGVYYGQCSEICGVNHGFMPIVVRGVIADKFAIWTLIKIDELQKEYELSVPIDELPPVEGLPLEEKAKSICEDCPLLEAALRECGLLVGFKKKAFCEPIPANLPGDDLPEGGLPPVEDTPSEAVLLNIDELQKECELPGDGVPAPVEDTPSEAMRKEYRKEVERLKALFDKHRLWMESRELLSEAREIQRQKHAAQALASPDLPDSKKGDQDPAN